MANFTGKIFQAVLNILLVPFYIKLLGIESYGLVGVFNMIQGISFILDIGLGATLIRELAKLSANPSKRHELRNLSHTMEVIYWIFAVIIGIGIIVIAPWIARSWVNAENIDNQTIVFTIRLMGIAVTCQWLVSFYSGGLIGLQKQVLNNSVNVIIHLFRGIGSLLILYFISATISAFFIWQIITGITSVFLFAFSFWKNIRFDGSKPEFKIGLFSSIWRFAAGVSGITILSTIISQMDKVILSRIVTLTDFGYYTIAGVVALSLFNIITPVFNTVYPRLVELVHNANETVLTIFYHKSCQLMSLFIIPVAIVVFFYSQSIIQVWTQNASTANNTYEILSLLVISIMITAILQIPNGIQMSFGYTKLIFSINVIVLVIGIPLSIFLVKKYGIFGGAMSSLITSIIYLFIDIFFMHKIILKTEREKWIKLDVGLPLLVSMIIMGFGRVIINGSHSHLFMLIFAFILLIITFCILLLINKYFRSWIIRVLSSGMKYIQRK